MILFPTCIVDVLVVLSTRNHPTCYSNCHSVSVSCQLVLLSSSSFHLTKYFATRGTHRLLMTLSVMMNSASLSYEVMMTIGTLFDIPRFGSSLFS